MHAGWRTPDQKQEYQLEGPNTHRQNSTVCMGCLATLFYIGMPILIVSLFAYFLSGMPIFTVKVRTMIPIYSHKFRYRDAYFYVKIGIRGMRISGDAYIHLTLVLIATCVHALRALESHQFQRLQAGPRFYSVFT